MLETHSFGGEEAMKEVLKLHRENKFSQAELNYNCTIIKTFMENANLTPTAGFLLSRFLLTETFPSSVCVCVCEREWERENVAITTVSAQYQQHQ